MATTDKPPTCSKKVLWNEVFFCSTKLSRLCCSLPKGYFSSSFEISSSFDSFSCFDREYQQVQHNWCSSDPAREIMHRKGGSERSLLPLQSFETHMQKCSKLLPAIFPLRLNVIVFIREDVF
jgi:hypothetical protein